MTGRTVGQVTLKLVQKPAHILASVVKFEHIVDAANAVIGIEKVRPPTLARCELLNTEVCGSTTSPACRERAVP
jgi:hypothetical protein